MSILTSQRLGYQKALTLRTRFTAPNNVRIGYLVVGRPIAWDANDTPSVATDTTQQQFDTANFLLGGKKITGNDVALIIPRKNWTANTVYTQYDDRSAALFSSANSMYVYTSAGNVYKCLSNGGGLLSTIQPSGDYLTNNGVITQGDGYIWKYMYKIDSSDKFITSSWIPVPTEQNVNYFGHANNVIAGSISSIILESGGTGYVANSTTVSITGSGVSATASANISNGVITHIRVLNPGISYNRQNSHITITGVGSNANARIVLADIYGHAYNPAQELGANSVMFSVKIGEGDATEGGLITANNDFRQVGLLMEPHKYNSNVAVSIDTANLVVKLTTACILTSGGALQLDELVYQGSSVANATFTGYVADLKSNSIEVVGIEGSPTVGVAIRGNTSGSLRTLVSVTPPDLQIGSGDLVYIENIAPITRSVGQAESIKLILQF